MQNPYSRKSNINVSYARSISPVLPPQSASLVTLTSVSDLQVIYQLKQTCY